MTVVDCVIASYEHDALAVRDAELAGVVDLRVVAWGTETFRGGRPEPLPDWLVYGETATPTVVQPFDFPLLPDPWAREHALRQFSLDCGARWGGEGALLLLADGDEVPHPAAVESADGPSLLPVDYREWYLDLRAPDGWSPPHQPLLGTYADYAAAGGAQAARAAYSWPRQGPRGWHLSTLGDGAMARAKVTSFAHSEYDHGGHNGTNLLDRRRSARRDFLDRFDLEDAGDDLPTTAGGFPHLLAPR